MTIILLSVLGPTITVLFGASMLTAMKLNKTKSNSIIKGTKVFRYDDKTGKLFLYDEIWNKKQEKAIFKSNRPGKWNRASSVFAYFEKAGFSKKLANAVIKVKAGDGVQNFEVITTLKHKKKVVIKTNVGSIGDSAHINLIISWNLFSKSLEVDTAEKITQQDVADDHLIYKAFVGFNLNTGIHDVEKLFLSDIDKMVNKLGSKYFFSQNTLIIYTSSNNLKRLTKTIEKCTKTISALSKRIGTSRLFSGSTYIISKDVNSVKRVGTILGAIDFNVNLSIRKNVEFMNKDHESFNGEEYKAFVSASSVFRSSIKTDNISFKEVPVKKVSSNRKIMSYAFPVVNGISEEVQKTILRNRGNLHLLRDSFAKMIAIEKKVKSPLLIDVNQSWIEENYKKMVYKGAIYVINLNPSSNGISRTIIEELKNNGFNIAVKLDRQNESIITIIRKIKPQFIVVGETLTNNASSSSLISLISIRKSATNEGVRLIHENPSTDIDEKMKEKIGIQYAYHLEK